MYTCLPMFFHQISIQVKIRAINTSRTRTYQLKVELYVYRKHAHVSQAAVSEKVVRVKKVSIVKPNAVTQLNCIIHIIKININMVSRFFSNIQNTHISNGRFFVPSPKSTPPPYNIYASHFEQIPSNNFSKYLSIWGR